MKYAVIVWGTANEVLTGTGAVYGWYKSLATAINTATNLQQFYGGTYYKATVVKVI